MVLIACSSLWIFLRTGFVWDRDFSNTKEKQKFPVV